MTLFLTALTYINSTRATTLSSELKIVQGRTNVDWGPWKSCPDDGFIMSITVGDTVPEEHDAQGITGLSISCESSKSKKSTSFGISLQEDTDRQELLCGPNQIPCGVSVHSDSPHNHDNDHLGIASMRIACCNTPTDDKPTYGEWSRDYSGKGYDLVMANAPCPSGWYLCGIQVKGTNASSHDYHGLEGLNARCCPFKADLQVHVLGDGLPSISWNKSASCADGQVVSSLYTKHAQYRKGGDNEGITGLQVKCKDLTNDNIVGQKLLVAESETPQRIAQQEGWIHCPNEMFACGYTGRFQMPSSAYDSVALISLDMLCCNRNHTIVKLIQGASTLALNDNLAKGEAHTPQVKCQEDQFVCRVTGKAKKFNHYGGSDELGVTSFKFDCCNVLGAQVIATTMKPKKVDLQSSHGNATKVVAACGGFFVAGGSLLAGMIAKAKLSAQQDQYDLDIESIEDDETTHW